MKLEPAALRLREIAKTHADGGIARQDYLRARRDIIEELHIDFAEQRVGDQSPFDRFSMSEADGCSEQEECMVDAKSAESPISRLAWRRFGRALAGVMLALLIFCAGLIAGQPINATLTPSPVKGHPGSNL